MRTLQADPVAGLEPLGDPALGLLIPAGVLVASIALSLYLYWRFARPPRGS